MLCTRRGSAPVVPRSKAPEREERAWQRRADFAAVSLRRAATWDGLHRELERREVGIAERVELLRSQPELLLERLAETPSVGLCS